MPRARPPLDWLPEARTALNGDPAFRKLGSADFELGLVAGEDMRVVSFDAFEITDASEVDAADLRDADVVIQMTPKEWSAYLRQRAKGRGATLLSLDLERRVVKSADPLKRLVFERYNRTIQALIDQGATLTIP